MLLLIHLLIVLCRSELWQYAVTPCLLAALSGNHAVLKHLSAFLADELSSAGPWSLSSWTKGSSHSQLRFRTQMPRKRMGLGLSSGIYLGACRLSVSVGRLHRRIPTTINVSALLFSYRHASRALRHFSTLPYLESSRVSNLRTLSSDGVSRGAESLFPRPGTAASVMLPISICCTPISPSQAKSGAYQKTDGCLA